MECYHNEFNIYCYMLHLRLHFNSIEEYFQYLIEMLPEGTVGGKSTSNHRVALQAAKNSKVLPKPDGPLASLVPSYNFHRRKISQMNTSTKSLQLKDFRNFLSVKKFLAIQYLKFHSILVSFESVRLKGTTVSDSITNVFPRIFENITLKTQKNQLRLTWYNWPKERSCCMHLQLNLLQFLNFTRHASMAHACTMHKNTNTYQHFHIPIQDFEQVF